jgi:hypothetical protein
MLLIGILTKIMLLERTGAPATNFDFIYSGALAWLGRTRSNLRRKLKHANNATGRTLVANSASKVMKAVEDDVGSTFTRLPPPPLAVWLLPTSPSPSPPPLLLLTVKSSARRCKKLDMEENNFHAANAETDKKKTQVVEGSHI